MEIAFEEFGDRILVFVGCLGSSFSDFLGLEDKLENEANFYEKPNLEPWIWGRISWWYLGPLKTSR